MVIMNKYTSTLVFYLASIAIIFLLNKISPNAHDGGLGFGTVAILLFGLILIALIGVTIYKGIKTDKSYFIITLIHFVVLTFGVSNFLM
jgi:uncharacterized membrane protein